jgi:hypothetical protein
MIRPTGIAMRTIATNVMCQFHRLAMYNPVGMPRT